MKDELNDKRVLMVNFSSDAAGWGNRNHWNTPDPAFSFTGCCVEEVKDGLEYRRWLVCNKAPDMGTLIIGRCIKVFDDHSIWEVVEDET